MPSAPTLLLEDLAATARLATRVAAAAAPGDAILLDGPLGVGKTALARALLRALAADPALEVPSPSYTLVQTYPLPQDGAATHFDLYRLSGPTDLTELGWEEARAGIVLVEWPDRLGPLRPADALTITLAFADTPDARRAQTDGWQDRLR